MILQVIFRVTSGYAGCWGKHLLAGMMYLVVTIVNGAVGDE